MIKPIIVAAGGLVVNKKNNLLMIYRRGKWDLPKGKLDKGESIETCALREVQEETGLQNITLGKLIMIGCHEYFDKYIQQFVIKETHWYQMQVSGKQNLLPQAEEDITDIKWISKKELGSYLADSYPNIADVCKKAGFIDSVMFS